jgi:hypothetical protein
MINAEAEERQKALRRVARKKDRGKKIKDKPVVTSVVLVIRFAPPPVTATFK